MKIRNGFVTNSSSSSFIIAKQKKFTEIQKEMIIDIVSDHIFSKSILTPESTDEEIKKAMHKLFIYDEETEEKIKEALKNGNCIYYSNVDECETLYLDLISDILKKVNDVDDKNKITSIIVE